MNIINLIVVMVNYQSYLEFNVMLKFIICYILVEIYNTSVGGATPLGCMVCRELYPGF